MALVALPCTDHTGHVDASCKHFQRCSTSARATVSAWKTPGNLRSAGRCPPGHGDIYPSLLGSGMLDRLRKAGIKYVFVSNSDNLGATLDLDLLAFFAKSDSAFTMEARARRPPHAQRMKALTDALLRTW